MNSKKAQITIIAMFLVFTFGLSAAFFIAPKSDYSSAEKRYLKSFPQVSVDSFLSGDLSTQLEGDEKTNGYIPDHFPFRSFFVGVNSYFNLLTGSTASNGYYFCKDGYIITKPPETNRSELNMSLINNFAASYDEVTLAVIPSAGYILEDKLPLNHTSYPDDEVFSYIENCRAENVNFLDLREDFSKASESGAQLYYKTDHHWTSEGAYLGYEKLCEALDVTPQTKDSFDISRYENFYGTTYSSSGYFLTKPDTLELWENKDFSDSITVTVTEGSEKNEFSSMYFLSHLEEDDMYPVFLDGNHALVEIENTKAESDKTLVIIKDSYAHCLTPFLAENYQKIIMVDMRYYKDSVSNIISAEGDAEILFLYGMNNFCTDNNLAFLG